jgi:tyrosine decarboxylase
LAKLFEELVNSDSRFEIVVPRTITLVCFRLKHENAEELNKKLLLLLNESGKIYLSHAIIRGVYTIRFAIGGTNQQEQHIRNSWQLIQETATKVLQV